MRRSTVLSLPPQLVFPVTVVKFYSIGPKKQMIELIVEKKNIFISTRQQGPVLKNFPKISSKLECLSPSNTFSLV